MEISPLRRDITARVVVPEPARRPRVSGPSLAQTPAPRPKSPGRVEVAGKFLCLGDRKFFLRGVTYGPFAPEPDGSEYHTPTVVDRDFARMAAHGFNTVRTYTAPPRWVLDLAQEHGLRLFIGLPWEQHVTFLDSRARRNAIAARVRQAVAGCERHPAVLGYAVGNEIPASIVRWHGRRPVESFIERLYEEAKSQHPEALVTYVNFPTTEYLDLPFLDFFAWNVYLETPSALGRYLARLQNLAGEKPLALTEIGLDSLRNGEQAQADTLDWQIRAVGAAGCAGAFLFSWTDEWHRSGQEILDWNFGLIDRQRQPKAALASASEAFDQYPLPPEPAQAPLVSVVVCSYNGARTLRETLTTLCALDYPRYEVLVIDDGSVDATPVLARSFPVRVLSTPNRGLSHARNLGLREALGEIVVYIDDDAYPDPLWLRYLVHTFQTTDHAAVGGPNVCPPSDSETAQCVSHSPGGPNHVLLSDTLAEHIPGCNMAFRRDALLAIGGFDERFRIAGDDVDLCWRLIDSGRTLGFQPAAMVWHHSRGTIRGYLKQQYNYGRAEAMLEAKWPCKYNSAGHPQWGGRLYSRGQRDAFGLRHSRVYHGVWGSSLFQSLYTRPPGAVRSLPLLPEWYLLIALLGLVSLAAVAWPPLLWTLPALLLASGALLSQAISAAVQAQLPFQPDHRLQRLRQRATIALLHLLQPMVRLGGRLSSGLHPLRRRGGQHFVLPRARRHSIWHERWKAPSDHLEELEQELRAQGAAVRRGGPYDSWDLEVRGGLFGSLRLAMGVEEHGRGRQLVRLRSLPVVSRFFAGAASGAAIWFVMAAVIGLRAPIAFGALMVGLLTARAFFDCAAASSAFDAVMRRPTPSNQEGTVAPPRDDRSPTAAEKRIETFASEA